MPEFFKVMLPTNILIIFTNFLVLINGKQWKCCLEEEDGGQAKNNRMNRRRKEAKKKKKKRMQKKHTTQHNPNCFVVVYKL